MSKEFYPYHGTDIKLRKSEYKKMKQEIEELRAKLADTLERRVELSREVQQLKYELSSAKETITEKQKRIEKLEWQLSQFKCIGTDQCKLCECGRVSLFMANQECISCNPRTYDTYEAREALSDKEG